MDYLQRALLRFILPLAITVVLLGLALAFGQINPGVRSASASPLWAGAHIGITDSADGDRDRDHRPRRYYDREHKDYHEWSEQEEHAYREWLEQQRREYKEFAKLHRREQREYWHWRHEHPEER